MSIDSWPSLPEGWAYFSDWKDGLFAIANLLLVLLIIIWWRQQTRYWFRITTLFLLCAVLICIGSYYMFQVPFHHISCPAGCSGWRGYPQPVATMEPNGVSQMAALDFGFNLLIIWLAFLGAGVVWRVLAIAVDWSERSLRAKGLFLLLVCVLPWALLPRIFNPPQPTPTGENLRITNNALRIAEFTYNITGFWVQRLAVEDIRQSPPSAPTPIQSEAGTAAMQVCLRGYTYFYLPWRRYVITLDPTGVTALQMEEIRLSGSCWEAIEVSAPYPAPYPIVPGAGRLRSALSMTRIQSAAVCGVKICAPVLAKVPKLSELPSRGLYHQARAAEPAT